MVDALGQRETREFTTRRAHSLPTIPESPPVQPRWRAWRRRKFSLKNASGLPPCSGHDTEEGDLHQRQSAAGPAIARPHGLVEEEETRSGAIYVAMYPDAMATDTITPYILYHDHDDIKSIPWRTTAG
jgi:hypothetical protein